MKQTLGWGPASTPQHSRDPTVHGGHGPTEMWELKAQEVEHWWGTSLALSTPSPHVLQVPQRGGPRQSGFLGSEISLSLV